MGERRKGGWEKKRVLQDISRLVICTGERENRGEPRRKDVLSGAPPVKEEEGDAREDRITYGESGCRRQIKMIEKPASQNW